MFYTCFVKAPGADFYYADPKTLCRKALRHRDVFMQLEAEFPLRVGFDVIND